MSSSSSAPPHCLEPGSRRFSGGIASEVAAPGFRDTGVSFVPHHGSPPFPAQPPLAVSQAHAQALLLHSHSELPQIWGSPHSSNNGKGSMSQGSQF